MSRCLPFPPPCYAWNGVGGEALLQFLKVRRENAEAKKEKRRKKKQKNSARRRKKRGKQSKGKGKNEQNTSLGSLSDSSDNRKYINEKTHLSQYRELVVDWVAPPKENVKPYTDLDDLEWLFGTNAVQKSEEFDDNLPLIKISTGLSCVKYLSQVETFALPFVVPY